MKGLTLLCLLVAGAHGAPSQTVTAIPSLNLDTYTGQWYEIARIPNKQQKKCISDAFDLIARADKIYQLQVVSSCQTKSAYLDVRNGVLKRKKKAGDGRLKLSFLWPFSTPYVILALGPDNTWSLVGSPNHKMLWIYAKTPSLKPEVLAEIKAKADAEGFSSAQLVNTPQGVPEVRTRVVP